MKNLKLQAARLASGKTQAEIARAANVSDRMYQKYEYGRNEPGVRTAIRIADALGVVDLRELFAEATEENTQFYSTTCQTLNQEKNQENRRHDNERTIDHQGRFEIPD